MKSLFPLLIWLLIATQFAISAGAQPLPSRDIAQDILEGCDAQAFDFDDYDLAVKSATTTLMNLGVFSEAEFRGVKIGFCHLRAANGPVATTSCVDDTILLDEKYRDDDQRLVRAATLAHEMKHHLQHAQQRKMYGPGYCNSEHYEKDKTWMETDADKFGDDVAALLFAGRPVEIRNTCEQALSVYLETVTPGASIQSFFDLLEIPALSNAITPHRSTSKYFRVYARSDDDKGERLDWNGAVDSETRDIGGKTYRLKNITMANAARSIGPFVLRLTCR
ncbi:MAG: hypothetical protein HKN14_02625 [Marinicaulis sp.]|nr:hypothetical protein [Marinicaulis sp.]